MADLPTQRDFDDFGAWSGRDVVGPDGERLGVVDLIFLDEATRVPEWVLVRLDDGTAFVPLAGASVEERSIRVAQARERVEAAPTVEVGDTLSVADEKRLYEHYGLDYSREESSTLLAEGGQVEAGAPAAAQVHRRSRPRAGERGESRACAGHGAAQPQLRDALPIPPAVPQVTPPEGGFQALEEQSAGSRLRLAIPAVLAGALAGLIAVLAWRRRS